MKQLIFFLAFAPLFASCSEKPDDTSNTRDVVTDLGQDGSTPSLYWYDSNSSFVHRGICGDNVHFTKNDCPDSPQWPPLKLAVIKIRLGVMIKKDLANAQAALDSATTRLESASTLVSGLEADLESAQASVVNDEGAVASAGASLNAAELALAPYDKQVAAIEKAITNSARSDPDLRTLLTQVLSTRQPFADNVKAATEAREQASLTLAASRTSLAQIQNALPTARAEKTQAEAEVAVGQADVSEATNDRASIEELTYLMIQQDVPYTMLENSPLFAKMRGAARRLHAVYSVPPKTPSGIYASSAGGTAAVAWTDDLSIDDVTFAFRTRGYFQNADGTFASIISDKEIRIEQVINGQFTPVTLSFMHP